MTEMHPQENRHRERYARFGADSKTALAELWSRPGQSHRDRRLATEAALIEGHRATELPHQMELALAARVRRRLATVFSALPVANDVFDKRRR